MLLLLLMLLLLAPSIICLDKYQAIYSVYYTHSSCRYSGAYVNFPFGTISDSADFRYLPCFVYILRLHVSSSNFHTHWIFLQTMDPNFWPNGVVKGYGSQVINHILSHSKITINRVTYRSKHKGPLLLTPRSERATERTWATFLLFLLYLFCICAPLWPEYQFIPCKFVCSLFGFSQYFPVP